MFEIREKPEMVERAMLVSIYFDPSEAREKQAMLDELEDLVTNLGISIAGKHLIKSRDMHAKFLCGTGKAQEVKQLALDCRADCVVFDNMLSPSQQREWERLIDECVIDREEVILDIFAGAHARGRPPSRWSWPACSIPCRAWPACGTTWTARAAVPEEARAAAEPPGARAKNRLKWTAAWRAPG